MLLGQPEDMLADQEENPREGAASEEEEEDGAAVLDWDEQLEDPPATLRMIYQGVQAGSRRLELKTVFSDIPRFQDVPWRAPENNFRQDSKSPLDGTVKNWSQWTLHQMRMQMLVYQLLCQRREPECSACGRCIWPLMEELPPGNGKILKVD